MSSSHSAFVVLGLAAAILQAGKWQFLFFKGTFDVRLHVEEASEDRTITFTLAESTFMRNFEGRWQVGASRLNEDLVMPRTARCYPQPFATTN